MGQTVDGSDPDDMPPVSEKMAAEEVLHLQPLTVEPHHVSAHELEIAGGARERHQRSLHAAS